MENIRIQDDLYNYVNQEWLETAVIPDDKPLTGGFADLDSGIEKQLIKDFKKMSKEEKYPNEYLKYAVKLFEIAKDTKRRNKDGMKPCLSTLRRIQDIKDIKDFNNKLVDLFLDSIPLPFNISVDPDMKDTDFYSVLIQGPSTILPDVTYYKNPQQSQAMLGMWSGVAKQILMETKMSESVVDEYIANTIKFDSIIATLVKSAEEWSNYVAIYNPESTSTVASKLSPINFKSFLKGVFMGEPAQIIVADPRFLKGFKTLFNEENFKLYKAWAFTLEAIRSCSYLSEDLRILSGSFRRALMGVQAAPSVEKFAYQLASGVYSEPVGLYYGETYFGEKAKKDVIEMVKEIIATYQSRIMKNDFLSKSTKEKAVLKLKSMAVKMGYPDKVSEKYNYLKFSDGLSLYEIMSLIGRTKKEYEMSRLREEVDRTEWPMPGHMVNACYNPFSNDITFPAAILQAPFYSIKQTRSQNLGGIGAVIGHEISHAFDNNGSAFDEKGNLNNWWTEQDHKSFEKRTKAMIDEFDGIELPWGKTNGAFIVSENIADNGGMGCTLEIMKGMKEKSYEEYFTNWAKVWCMKAKPEYLALIINIDVHAPAILRANMQPRNFPEWYETFKVVKTDKMYLDPKKRVTIW